MAESCWYQGWASGQIVNYPGASKVLEGGFVTYSNEAKMNLLGVKQETLEKFGAVSEQTAAEMASGAAKVLGTETAISITGIAGPGGGSPEKPVGTVWIAAGYKNEIHTYKQETNRGRSMNIERAGNNALLMLRDLLK